MKNDKLNQLFKTARQAQPPAAGPDFEDEVMRAVRREPGRGPAARRSMFDELGSLFPRLAWVAAVVIALCVAADFGLGSSGGPDLDEGVLQVSSHWLFTSDGL